MGAAKMLPQCTQKTCHVQEIGLCYNTYMERSFKQAATLNAGLILLAFAAFAGLFYFVNGKLNEQTKAIVENRVMLSRATGASERLAVLKQDQPLARGYARLIGLFLPPQENLLDLPRDIEEVGRVHQVGALFTFSGSENTQGNTLAFNITATGPGTNLIDFLKEIEVSYPKYTLAIDSVDITGSDPQSQQLLAMGRVFFKP